MILIKTNQTALLLEIDQPKGSMWECSPGINGLSDHITMLSLWLMRINTELTKFVGKKTSTIQSSAAFCQLISPVNHTMHLLFCLGTQHYEEKIELVSV